MKNVLRVGVGLIVALVTLAMPAAPRTLAAPSVVTFTVDTTADLTDTNLGDGICPVGSCSLRAAIMQANVIPGPGVTIILPSGTYTVTRPPLGADGDDSGDLNLTAPAVGNPVISIVGAGAPTTVIDGNQFDRVFHVHAGRTATISGVTIRNGLAPGTLTGGGIWNLGVLTVSGDTIDGNAAYYGGGIDSAGTLTVVDSTFSGNTAPKSGGGIYNSGTMTMSLSAGSGNTATVGYGGGIYNYGTLNLSQSTLSGNTATYGGGVENPGTLTVIDSTLSGNTATVGDGGGIDNVGTLNLSQSTLNGNTAVGSGGGILNFSTLFVTNSTLSQNNANTNGGGIDNVSGTANVYNTTIVFNGADFDGDHVGSAGGVYNGLAATFNLRNTLVAGNNHENSPLIDDCTGTLISYGRNLIGTDADPANCMVGPGSGSWITLNSIDTLSPLQNNGGPTWTHALLPASNAIDGGDPDSGCVDAYSVLLATDQRGFARPGGAQCDVGAFEYYPPGPFLPLIAR